MRKVILLTAVLILVAMSQLFGQKEVYMNIPIAEGKGAKFFFTKYIVKNESITYYFSIKAGNDWCQVFIPRIIVDPNKTQSVDYQADLEAYNEKDIIIPLPVSVSYILFENIEFYRNGKSTRIVSKLVLFNNAKIPNYLNQVHNSNIIRVQLCKDDTLKQLCTVSSDLDENIPKIEKTNINRYTLIIGNEDYKSFEKTTQISSNVPFAQCDAIAFKNYARNLMGVDESNIFLALNATGSMMNEKLDILSKIIKKSGGEAEILFYYAGHGLPDEKTKEPYLIPVDVNPRNVSNAIKLSDVCDKLVESGAGKVIVLLDACFSGGGREADLISSRSVKIKPIIGNIEGNVLVISSCSGDETALAYNQKGHGLFTYFLLHKIKDKKGDITYGELYDYLYRTVGIESLKINQKEQTPTYNTGAKSSDAWKNWKL
ncbi:MAG: caspase family protein [Bacteroidetes bacterium]|nr:caspase family protein [Bacteroidota bacterium]